MYDREGAKGCVGCKSQKDIKFQKLFIIPCKKPFQSKYLNDIFMTKPREIVFEGEGGMKKGIQKWLPQGLGNSLDIILCKRIFMSFVQSNVQQL